MPAAAVPASAGAAGAAQPERTAGAAAGAPPLLDGVLRGERRAIGRALSAVEAGTAEGEALLQALHPRTGRAHVVGVTGSPGTGKSTLVDRLIEHHRRAGLEVAVVAVDPSSPFTGGAILGDRIRMQRHASDAGVFIRSMGTRGALGGLSAHTAAFVQVLDGAGYDLVLVETVGVGQAEVDIVRLADTVCVVLVPNLGDDVQAVKAGLMEIADVFVVNKSDLSGADKVVGEVEGALMLAHPELGAWTPPIVRTSAERGLGVAELAQAVAAHHAWARAGGALRARRRARLLHEVRARIQAEAVGRVFDRRGEPLASFAPVVAELEAGRLSPAEAARRAIE